MSFAHGKPMRTNRRNRIRIERTFDHGAVFYDERGDERPLFL